MHSWWLLLGSLFASCNYTHCEEKVEEGKGNCSAPLFLFKRGRLQLTVERLAAIHNHLKSHHSRDKNFLGQIRSSIAEMANSWYCKHCQLPRRATAEFCSACGGSWYDCMDRSYNPAAQQSQPRGWNAASSWEQPAQTWPKKPEKPRPSQSPKRWNQEPHTPRNADNKGKGKTPDKGKGKGKQSGKDKSKSKTKEAAPWHPPTWTPTPVAALPPPIPAPPAHPRIADSPSIGTCSQEGRECPLQRCSEHFEAFRTSGLEKLNSRSTCSREPVGLCEEAVDQREGCSTSPSHYLEGLCDCSCRQPARLHQNPGGARRSPGEGGPAISPSAESCPRIPRASQAGSGGLLLPRFWTTTRRTNP